MVEARQATNQNPTPAPSPYYFGTPSVDQRALTPEQTAEADAYFLQLEAEGAYESWKYMSSHVPAHLQEYFLTTHPDPTAVPPVGGVMADANPNLDPNFDPRVRR